jgi:hypothetical protein
MPNSTTPTTLNWLPRERPLTPCAVVAQGEAAQRLARRLLEYPDAELAQLQGVAERGTLVIRGEMAVLPWAEGVLYLGQDAEAPALLLPTALRPDFPAALLERAVRTQFPAVAPPVAVLPGTQQVVSLAAARTVARANVQAWLEGRL